jgi:hypothetical protein
MVELSGISSIYQGMSDVERGNRSFSDACELRVLINYLLPTFLHNPLLDLVQSMGNVAGIREFHPVVE